MLYLADFFTGHYMINQPRPLTDYAALGLITVNEILYRIRFLLYVKCSYSEYSIYIV